MTNSELLEADLLININAKLTCTYAACGNTPFIGGVDYCSEHFFMYAVKEFIKNDPRPQDEDW